VNFGPEYLEKCPSDPLYIILVFDQVEGEEYESEVKTGTGSSVGRHFGYVGQSSKFQKIIKRVTRISYLQISDILWPQWSSTIVPNFSQIVQ